jgi:hypothetical protein
MVGRLQDKIALVAGAGSVGPGWGNGKARQSYSPAKARRSYALMLTSAP